MRRRVAVIGGGITGLAAAYRLRVDGGDDTDVAVFERARDVGGCIGTERRDGWLLEKGPDTFLARKPETAVLAAELGIDGELISTLSENRRSYVARGGRLAQIPDGMSGLVPGRIGPLLRSGLLSWPGKLRAAVEPIIPARTDTTEETVAALATRRFGDEVYERLLEPLLCGIYAGDGRRLSAAATVPQLVSMEREHGSVLRAVQHARHDASRAAGPGFLTFRDGMGRLVDALLEHVEHAVHRDRSVEAVERRGGEWTVRIDGVGSEWDAVILAGPAWMSARLLADTIPELSNQLAAIESVSTAAVWCGYAEEDLPTMPVGYGYVVPRREQRDALACSWSDQKLPDRAPAGMRLFRVFVGRAGMSIDGRSEEDLLRTARTELAQTLNIQVDPVLTKVIIHDRAMPQYTLGHGERIARIQEHARQHRGLHLAGNWIDGVGVSDCIRLGSDAARDAMRHQSAEVVRK